MLWARLEEAGKCSGRSNVRGRSAELKSGILMISQHRMGLACRTQAKPANWKQKCYRHEEAWEAMPSNIKVPNNWVREPM